MIIVSSIMPNNLNSINAVKTWSTYGKVYSLNSELEIGKIDGYNGVTFLSTHRIMIWNNRTLVNINAMIDWAIQCDEDLLLINSDIIINNLPEFKNDGITILTRCDYTEKFEDGNLYEHGFDAWFFPKQFLKLFPQYIYCLGNVWHDYAWAYFALTNNIPVYWPQGKCIYHKMHNFQWDFDEWTMMAGFFKMYFKIDKYVSLEQLSINTLAEIKNRSIK